jgi:nucleoside-diphosphate-sugar epimerase
VSDKVVTITGGSGYVGQLLRVGLRQRGYRVEVFDQVRGPLVNLLRRRFFGTSGSKLGRAAAHAAAGAQKRLEPALSRAGIVRPTWDNVLDFRSRLASRFSGNHAVVHLAGIPHPRQPGTVDADFRRINYDGSVNVFEAAREAGVRKFIFASSAQVYGINNPVRIDQFPILESNYCPTREEGQTEYGWLKLEFERYLEAANSPDRPQSMALRLEFPGFRSTEAYNFYTSTSIDNLVEGFVCALEAPDDFAFEAFNLVDGEVDESVIDIQEFIRGRWSHVPNRTIGNECLLSTEKARSMLGYRPIRDGRYLDLSLIWR